MSLVGQEVNTRVSLRNGNVERPWAPGYRVWTLPLLMVKYGVM
jgi:hypothetical protein